MKHFGCYTSPAEMSGVTGANLEVTLDPLARLMQFEESCQSNRCD
jgi:hypothetical protein